MDIPVKECTGSALDCAIQDTFTGYQETGLKLHFQWRDRPLLLLLSENAYFNAGNKPFFVPALPMILPLQTMIYEHAVNLQCKCSSALKSRNPDWSVPVRSNGGILDIFFRSDYAAPFKMYWVGFRTLFKSPPISNALVSVRSSLPSINRGVWIELTFFWWQVISQRHMFGTIVPKGIVQVVQQGGGQCISP